MTRDTFVLHARSESKNTTDYFHTTTSSMVISFYAKKKKTVYGIHNVNHVNKSEYVIGVKRDISKGR